MAYTANQYNYATPLSSATAFFADGAIVDGNRYFTLSDNSLDGSYSPISGDVGIWGTSVSDSNGVLPEPFVVTIEDTLTIHAFKIIGNYNNYPVDFTLDFYSGNTLSHRIIETNNANAQYTVYLPAIVLATRVVITVTRISAAGQVAQLYTVYNPAYIKRIERVTANIAEFNQASSQLAMHKTDRLSLGSVSYSHITNIISKTTDTCRVGAAANSLLTNVHSRMKEPTRHIYGKVYITYTDPILDAESFVDAPSSAYNSVPAQLLDNERASDTRFFTLYENDLSGRYPVSSEASQVGWVSSTVSDSEGYFSEPQSVTVVCTARPVTDLSIHFNSSVAAVAEDFVVSFAHADGTSTVREFVGNTEYSVKVLTGPLRDVVSVTVAVTKVSIGGYPAAIVDIPITSTVLYVGYKDRSDLISIDLLEELSYEDEIEALGGVSANEVTVVLDNSNSDFYFNNQNSVVATQLKRNRKIEPWLGVEIVPGTIEWYKLGTFWSHSWKVPVRGLTATVVGFDTIGLLDSTPFKNHQVIVDASIGELIEYVLDDAAQLFSFIEYKIDPALYDVHIPYAWFENSSHAAALRRISMCYPMHIYCDRDGRICAAPQKLQLDYYYDVWAESTNVINTSYDSLYTTLPNHVDVTVIAPSIVPDTELVKDEVPFVVNGSYLKIVNFSSPYVSGISVDIVCDASVSYTYKTYSWGAEITFTGTGSVQSIKCTGSSLDTGSTSSVVRRDEESIRLNGAVMRSVSADFIQTTSLATYILDRLFALSELDKYDATVDYRGDIALSINDPVLLFDGIAPVNRYNIKRHQLFWNGALSGTAELNT